MIVPFCAVCLVKIERKNCTVYHVFDFRMYSVRSKGSHIELHDYAAPLKWYCVRCIHAAIDVVVSIDESSTQAMLVRMEQLAAKGRAPATQMLLLPADANYK